MFRGRIYFIVVLYHNACGATVFLFVVSAQGIYLDNGSSTHIERKKMI